MEFAGIEKLSLVDFEGKLACTLFTRGCQYRCPFCYNAPLVLEPEGETVPFSDILGYLKRRTGIIDAVCITGGEPTLHPDLEDRLKEIRKLGFLIKLDTNGTNPEMVKKLVNAKLVDYVAMDIKNSPGKYPLTSGVADPRMENVKETARWLIEGHVPYEFRTTLVKEFHGEEDMKEIARWLKGAKRYRLQKFIDEDTCIRRGLHHVKRKEALKFKEILETTMEDVALRNYWAG